MPIQTEKAPIIPAYFHQLGETLQDPVLRRWRWLRLLRRVSPTSTRPVRPGDGAVEGAALYCAALAKGDENGAAQGLRQLVTAAEQTILPSGINCEGSSRRQLQLAGLYSSAWLAARQGQRPEQWRLAAIARSLFAALQAITLPGGLPDIGAAVRYCEQPDDPAIAELQRQARLDDLELLREDGWLRLDCGPWSGLWHCPPAGWPAEDGLGHQDATAAELHWQGLPLIVDPGSPPHSMPELEPLYRSHNVHSGISLDRREPYPFDRPFYGDAFRRAVAGPPPSLRSAADGVKITTDGFARFGGHRQIERHWRFEAGALRIEDLVLGTGRPLIERRLVTPWKVVTREDGLLLEQDGHCLRVGAEHGYTLHPARRWNSEGAEQALTLVLFAGRANLPWRGSLLLEPQS
jgi:hypothetical protein